MAFEDDVMDMTFLAGEDLSAKQYCFVELSADNTVVCCSNATTGNPIGVLQNKPTSGLAARVRIMGVSRMLAGEALTYGSLVGTDANGAAIAKTANTAKYLGVVLYGAASGTEASVLVFGVLNTISA